MKIQDIVMVACSNSVTSPWHHMRKVNIYVDIVSNDGGDVVYAVTSAMASA